jgi:alkaline phosphatase
MFRLLRAVLFAALVSCAQAAEPEPPAAIVLVISDGTSQELITAARVYAHGAAGSLELEKFPQTAIVRTYSLDDVVTDSSAGATAMARGIKADNRAVGEATPQSKEGPPSLLDVARKAGWSTGIVTDDSVTGATPASFLVEHRNRFEDGAIASKIVDQLGKRADIVIGGGAKWFTDLGDKVKYDSPEQHALVPATLKKLAGADAVVFTDWQPFVDFVAKGESTKPVLGTFKPAEFPFYADGERVPRVADMAVEAVRFLRAKDKPFFLMVEAGLPDKASHRGNAKRAMVEVLELDHMIAELRKAVPPGTLILVTTDHNTGGLAISGPPVPIESTRGDALLQPNPVTGKSILSWATGPGGDLPKSNLRERKIVASDGAEQVTTEEKKPTDPDYQHPAAMFTSSALHTGGDVWLLGEGPGSEKVHGYLDNTEIFRLIASQISENAGKSH